MIPTAAGVTQEDIPMSEAARQLEEGGADVVGYNCMMGPETMLPVIKELRKTCKVNAAFEKQSIVDKLSNGYTKLQCTDHGQVSMF